MTHSAINQLNSYSRNKEPFVAIIGYDDECFFACALDEVKNTGLSFKFNSLTPTNKARLSEFKFIPQYPPFLAYKDAFLKAREYFRSGDAYLLNLCFKTRLITDLSLSDIYTYSNAPLVIKFKDEFVCFTPEKFIQITNNKITTTPMKGTIDATLPNAANQLLSSQKEFSEQAMMVDLMRNDLSMVANSVSVERFRFIDKINTNRGEILQTSSEIVGELRAHYLKNFGDLFACLLPAGSITGTPKPRVCEIINEIEDQKRGYFSGIFVYFDGENLISWVLIRFIGRDKNGLYFHSGGGLTFESDLKAEYDELCKKVYLAF